jgi:hypothetical protein
MATTITKRVLSGSTNGFPINVSATAGGVTTVHTGVTASTTIDEVWIYAQNSSTAQVSLLLEWGISASQVIRAEVPPQDGPTLIIPGFPVEGRTTAIVISAFASTSNVISLYGYVNRIVQT